MALTVKTDDVTRVRKDVDPHGRLRGEWVNLYRKVAKWANLADNIKFAERAA